MSGLISPTRATVMATAMFGASLLTASGATAQPLLSAT